MEVANIVAGFLVGAVVGLTGVGGGALMTPVLVLLFGYSPQTAIGTDLFFAAFTKTAGWLVHGYRGTIDWQVLRRMSCGSIPGAVATVLYLCSHNSPINRSGILIMLIGMAIILTSVGLFLKPFIHRTGLIHYPGTTKSFEKYQIVLTIAGGMVIGVLVSLTSIGAGALGATILIYLYPIRMKTSNLVGTDIAHAIPLALVAGAGHLFIGNVNFDLLCNLLLGSVPGIVIGSLIGTRAPENLIRNALGAMLLVVGLKMILA